MTTMSTKTYENHEHDTFFRRSLGVLAIVVVLAFLVFVLRPVRSVKGPFSFGANQPSAIGLSVETAVFRYRCDQASEDAREAINYYADPCEDFHAYACGPTRGREREQHDDERSRLQRVLFQLSLLNNSSHVAVQAAVLFKSCLSMPLSLEVLLRNNMLDFLNIANLTAEAMLGLFGTSQDVANFSAMLSYAHGVRSFASIKQSGLDGTVVLSFSRPFSAYVNGSTVRELFEGTVQLLEIPRHVRSQTVDHLLLADQELATSLSEVSSFHVTIPGLTNATQGNVASSAWKKIFQDYASHKADVPISAPVASAEALKQVLMIIFDKLHPREAAAYAMAHALLPTQVIEVLLEEHRTDACFRLVGDIFSTSWQDLESYLLGFFDENREAQSVADSLVSTLKKMLEERSTLDKQKSDAAIARLKQLSFDLPSIEGLVNTVPSTTCRGNLTDNSLYWNLARCRATSHSVARAVNETRGRRERSSLPTTTIVLPVESLRPSYFCHGHVSLLNYATLGTELAAMLLRYIAESSHGAASSHSTAEWLKEALIQGITHNISTCLSKSSSQPLGRLLDEVALQTVAFQLALRASKSGSRASAWARIENAADAPAWKQTYFVKYCQRLCSKGVSHSLTTTLDAALVCNAVVMNSPEFARLFRCERGDPMVPSEYCLAV